ncbi:MAG: topoisomerase DNA-binding C4 zinc finger domain-containing protein [Solobacterium sp.]|nr:topoisomerase DNA-binding C4 zinc finger domain-containing protein [Solobacterium sp.]MCH4206339.1 topoisomerase DNA-binding C4 zinc finger domain-containing protein [Solobacterium sp.]MCH4227841.1 topoisomerase DNA-binding C4 zinc finger domain-containing protein [Solobacterium sp.]MCH4283201.1 topoisomerase DNA-binding C4 zinc finger domain-containing protein [Solobacterium sp.]
MAERLNIPYESIRSYIVFSERCTLKNVLSSDISAVITYSNLFLTYLRHDLRIGRTVYTQKGVDALYGSLEPFSHATEEEKSKHAEQTSGSICPWCGGELVLRQGKYGMFYGCRNYPRCTFTRKIK